MQIMPDLFPLDPQLSMGKQEAFETFMRDHEDRVTVEHNRELLKQRLVTNDTACYIPLFLAHLMLFLCTVHAATQYW